MKQTCQCTLIAGAALLALGIGSANADVTLVSTTVDAPMAYGFTPIAVATFDSVGTGTMGTFTDGSFSFSGDGIVRTGSSANVYQTPNNDSTNYLAVSSGTYPATETISSATTYGQFGIYWGSVDPYNTLTFTLDGVQVGSFTGTDIGHADSATGVYANFAGNFNGVTLTTTQANFEVDNLAVGGVPEPSTWAMMLIGFAGLATYMVRKNKTSPRAIDAGLAA